MKWLRWLQEPMQRRWAQALSMVQAQKDRERTRAQVDEQLRVLGGVFAVSSWQMEYRGDYDEYAGNRGDNTRVFCVFERKTADLFMLAVGEPERKSNESCTYYVKNRISWFHLPRDILHAEIVARGLYCLDIDDSDALEQLHPGFSFHEKLELRLSLPHEFWPQNWLEE